MQTFLPETNYSKSAEVLDVKRLGKQRVEAMQILTALTFWKWDNAIGKPTRVEKYGWTNHPATKMWKTHEYELLKYIQEICTEWRKRGYSDSCQTKSEEIFRAALLPAIDSTPWWYSEKLSSTHRQVLIFKEYKWYRQFNWSEKPKHEYYWPV